MILVQNNPNYNHSRRMDRIMHELHHAWTIWTLWLRSLRLHSSQSTWTASRMDRSFVDSNLNYLNIKSAQTRVQHHPWSLGPPHTKILFLVLSWGDTVFNIRYLKVNELLTSYLTKILGLFWSGPKITRMYIVQHKIRKNRGDVSGKDHRILAL